MIKRSTWVTLAFFVVLVGFAIYWQKSPETFMSPTPTPTPFPIFLPGWSEKEISLIEISAPDENIIVLKLDSTKQWALANSDHDQVAQGKIEELLTTLRTATIISAINNPVDPAVIGLEEPKLSIRLQNTKGETVLIKIGDKTPTDSGYYAQMDENLPVILRSITVEDLVVMTKKESLIATLPAPEGTPSTNP
ncbi:MAG: DUF4340 domain-containing protein [Anaerolineae bacterium]|nr:DUF4340 domain-containing protein [Anaerolineae bacterium]